MTDIKLHKVIEIDFEKIQPNKYNPKKSYLEDIDNLKQYEKIKILLQENNYQDKITVREIGKDKYEIIDGFHRWSALNDLGYDGKIQVVNMGKIDLLDAIAATLSIERIKIEIDDIKEAELLKKLKDENKINLIYKKMPYTEEEINFKVELLDYQFQPEEKEEKKEKKYFIKLECKNKDQKKIFIAYLNKISTMIGKVDKTECLEFALDFKLNNNGKKDK